MTAGTHGGNGKTGRLRVGLACMVLLAGCEAPAPTAPESRATFFVERFIRAPHAESEWRDLVELGDNPSPDSLLADLPTRNAMTYLRARATLGEPLGFHLSDTRDLAAGRKQVVVVVSEGSGVSRDPVRVRVELVRRDPHWKITRLQTE